MSAIIKPSEAELIQPAGDSPLSPLSSPPPLRIGLLLKDRRVVLGWSLEATSRKTGIPAQVLQAIEQTQLNMVINDVAKLDRHIRMYANRLGQSLLGNDALIAKAISAIRPKEVTEDSLHMIRSTP